MKFSPPSAVFPTRVFTSTFVFFFVFVYFIVMSSILIYIPRMLAKSLICLTGIDNNIILLKRVWHKFLLLYIYFLLQCFY